MLSSIGENVKIGKTCIIDQAKIGKSSFINPNVKIIHSELGSEIKIDQGSSIINSTIYDFSLIGSDCFLDNIKFGNNCSIGNKTTLSNSSLEGFNGISQDCVLAHSTMGSYTYVSQRSIIGHTAIGRFCSIGPNVICGYGNHPTNFISTSPVFYSPLKQCGYSFVDQSTFQETSPITIGNDVWIGANVFIKDGLTIGNGAVIGAGAVVVKDVEDYEIVGGVPARQIRFRYDEETIRRLLDIQWWNWDTNTLRQGIKYFTSDINHFLDYADSLTISI